MSNLKTRKIIKIIFALILTLIAGFSTSSILNKFFNSENTYAAETRYYFTNNGVSVYYTTTKPTTGAKYTFSVNGILYLHTGQRFYAASIGPNENYAVATLSYKGSPKVTLQTSSGSIYSTLTGNWTATTTPSGVSYSGTSSVTLPANAGESGVFMYWQDVSSGATYSGGSSYSLAYNTNATLKAVYNKNPEYTFTLSAEGGSIPATSGWTGSGASAYRRITFGSSIGVLPKPTRSGYTFNGWWTSNGQIVNDNQPYNTYGDLTIYAGWNQNSTGSTTYYTVTLDAYANGTIPSTAGWTITSSRYATKQVAAGSAIGTLPTPTTNDGRSFYGWVSNGTTYNATTKIYNNVTLYANWQYSGGSGGTSNNVVLTLIAGSVNGGVRGKIPATSGWTLTNNNSSAYKVLGTAGGTYSIGTLPIPTLSGYSPSGWLLPNGSSTHSAYQISTSTTLYVEWTNLSNSWSNNTSKPSGSGTSSSPFLIKTPQNLAWIATSVNSGSNLRAVISLCNDIDLSGRIWVPIGSNEYKFEGTFYGNNHTISNLTTSSSTAYGGLFGVITASKSGSTIYKAYISSVRIDGGSVASTNAAGGIAGWSTTTAYETDSRPYIVDCFVRLSSIKTSGDNAGGIVGTSNGVYINSCYVEISGSAGISAAYASGGIGGYFMGYGTITNSIAKISAISGGAKGAILAQTNYIMAATVSNNASFTSATTSVIGANYSGVSYSNCYVGTSGSSSRNTLKNVYSTTSAIIPTTNSNYKFIYKPDLNSGYPMVKSLVWCYDLPVTMQLNANGGLVSNVSTLSYTITVGQTTNFPIAGREGYTFLGWYTSGDIQITNSNGDLVQTSYTNNYSKYRDDYTTIKNLSSSSNYHKMYYYIMGALTLQAKWQANTYTVNFNGNMDTYGSMSPQTFTYGVAQNLTNVGFRRTGYDFLGWSTTLNGDVVYSNKESVSNLTLTNGGTVTLYAKWQAKKIVVTIDPNGGTYNGRTSNAYFSGNYGETSSVLLTPEKEGYTFAGWAPLRYDADGNAWIQIYYHNNSNANYLFTSESAPMTNEDVYRYSMLSNLDYLEYEDKYEFQLYYHDYLNTSGQPVYNYWSQTANPLHIENGQNQTASSMGYQGISINLTNFWSYGLSANVSTNAYLVANAGAGNTWRHPICSYTYQTTSDGRKGIIGNDTVSAIGGGQSLFVKAASDLSNISEALYNAGVYTFNGALNSNGQYIFRHTLNNHIALKAVWVKNVYTVTLDANGGTINHFKNNSDMSYTSDYNETTGHIKLNGSISNIVLGYEYRQFNLNEVVTLTIKQLSGSVNNNFTFYAYTQDSSGNNIGGTSSGITFTSSDTKKEQTVSYTINQSMADNGFKFSFVGKSGGSSTSLNNLELQIIVKVSPDTIKVDYGGSYGLANIYKGSSAADINGWYNFANISNNLYPGTEMFTTYDPSIEAGRCFALVIEIKNFDVEGTIQASFYSGGINSNYGASQFELIRSNLPSYLTGDGTYVSYLRSVDLSSYQYSKFFLRSHFYLNSGGTINSISVRFSMYEIDPIDLSTWNYTKYNQVISVPFATGKEFLGWYTDYSGGTLIDADSVYTATEDITLYAHWQNNIYTLTYDALEGTITEANGWQVSSDNKTATKQIEYSTYYLDSINGIVFPTVSSPNGKHYSYTIDSSGDEIIDGVTGFFLESNETITAHYDYNTYTIEYNSNKPSNASGSITGTMSASTHTYGTSKALNANQFALTGWTFAGWNTMADGSGTSYGNQASVKNLTSTNNGSVTLYAQWTQNKYNITYNPNGGTMNGSSSNITISNAGTYDSSSYQIPNYVPTRTGYTFAGWYDAASGGTKYINAYTSVTNPITGARTFNKATSTTFYALWTVNQYSLVVNLGSSGANVLVSSMPTITVESSAGTLSSSIITSKTGSVTISNINYGASVTITASIPSGSSYYLSNSSTLPSTVVTQISVDSTITKTASNSQTLSFYLTQVYTISYNSNGMSGTVPSSQTVYYNKNIVLATNNLTSSGYSPDGWRLNSATGTKYASGASYNNVKANATFFADKTANSYNITYNPNSGTMNGSTSNIVVSNAVKYNSDSYTIPNYVPARTGYTFLGWYDNATSGTKYINAYTTVSNPVTGARTWNKASSATLYAHWQINTYTVSIQVNNADYGSVDVSSVANVPYGTKLSVNENELTVNGTVVTATVKNITGYTTEFTSWTNGTATVSGNLSVTANFTRTINSYTLTANANGGTISATDGWTGMGSTATKELDYNENYGILPTITRTGYSFLGWFTAQTGGSEVSTTTKMGASDTTIYAHWEINSYTLTANANSGTISTTSGWTGTGNTATKELVYNTAYGTLPTVTRTGYSFLGWFTAQTGGSEVSTTTKMGASDTTIYAHWDINKFTVNINVNNSNYGSVSLTTVENVPYGTKLTVNGTVLTVNGTTITATITNLAGYTTSFTGWTNGTATVTKDTTVVANFSRVANVYNVTLHTNGGTINSNNVTSYTYGIGATLPNSSDITIQGETFVGWYENEGLTGNVVTVIKTTDIGDKEYWAKYSDNEYSVTLHTNGGTINSNNVTSYIYGEGATLPTASDIVKNGYTFAGWYASSTFTGQVITEISATEVGNKEFWAKWNVNTYNLTYVTNGGNAISSKLLTYNTYYTAEDLITPTRTGYSFDGWYSSSACTGDELTTNDLFNDDNADFENISAPNTNARIYAKWNINSYTLTANANGGTISATSGWSGIGNTSTKELDYNEAYGTLPTVSRTGYTFLGWFTSQTDGTQVSVSTNMGADDTTIYAHWDINKFTITINVNNSNYGSVNPTTVENVPYGTNIVVNENTLNINSNVATATINELTGYTTNFVDWTIDENVVYDDLTITANFERFANTYTITYDKNADDATGSMEMSTHTYDVSKELNLNNYQRVGWNFLGWSTNSTATTATFTDGESVKNLSSENGDNVILYAVWAQNKYTLVLNAGTNAIIVGGEVENFVKTQSTLTSSIKFEYWDSINLPNLFSDSTLVSILRNGYKFLGWSVTENDTTSDIQNGGNINGQILEDLNISVENNSTINLYAVWQAVTYSVEYDINGGEGTVANQTHTYNVAQALRPSTNLSSTGKTFVGWLGYSANLIDTNGYTNLSNVYIDEDGYFHININNTSSNSIIANINNTKYLQLLANENYYLNVFIKSINTNGNVLFVNGNSSQFNAISKNFDEFNVGNNILELTTISNVSTADTLLMTSVEVEAGASAEIVFRLALYEEINHLYQASETVRNLSNLQDDSLTMTAYWEANTFDITFKSNGGTINGSADDVEIIDSATYGENEYIVPDYVPTKEGYRFLGWFDAEIGGNQYIEGYSSVVNPVTGIKSFDKLENTIFYAHYEVVTYELNVNLNVNVYTMTNVTISVSGIHPDTGVQTNFLPVDDNSVMTSGGTLVYNIPFGTNVTITATINGNRYNLVVGNIDNATINKNTTVSYTLTKDTSVQTIEFCLSEVYTVTYNLNGGTGPLPSSQYYLYGQKITVANPSVITKNGYTGAYWLLNTSDYNTNVYIKGLSSGDEFNVYTGDSTLYCGFYPDKISAIIDLNDEDGSTSASYDDNGDMTIIGAVDYIAYLKEPTRAGYEFDSWTTNNGLVTLTNYEDGNNKWEAKFYDYVENVSTKEDIQNIDNSYYRGIKLIDNLNNELTFDTSYIIYATTYVNSSSTMAFSGSWNYNTIASLYVNDNLINTGNNSDINIDIAFTLNKGWNKIEVVLTVKEYFGKFIFSSNLSTMGVVNCYGESIQNDKMYSYTFTENTIDNVNVVSANWSKNSIQLMLDANGGEILSNTIDITFDEIPTNMIEANKVGYTFIGWTITKDGTDFVFDKNCNVVTNVEGYTDNVGNWIMPEDTTLYASWIAIKYIIHFDNGGTIGSTIATGTMNDMTFVYDESQNLSANNFVRNNYTFVGWTMNEANAVTYRNNYINNFGTTDEIGIDDILALEGVYADGESVMNLTNANDSIVTLFAIWIPNSYVISYVANEPEGTATGTTESSTHLWDVEKSLSPNGFVLPGYKLIGWAKSIDGSISYTNEQTVVNVSSTSITLYGVWVTDYVTITLDNQGGIGGLESINTVYKQTFPNVKVPSKENYVFRGYYSELNGSGTRYVDENGTGIAVSEFNTPATIYAYWAQAKVGDNYFSSIQDAVDSNTSADIIVEILCDIAMTETVNVTGSRVVTLIPENASITLTRDEAFTGRMFVNSANELIIDKNSLESIITFDGENISVNTSAIYSDNKLTIKAGTFQNFIKSSSGAVLYINSGSLVIEGGTFTLNNSSDNGGVIYGNSSTTITIEGGTFTSNSATNEGGVIYIDSSSLNSSTLTIKNGTFEHNTANYGGVIYGYRSSTITVEAGTFTSNSATHDGGVICGDDLSTITILDGNFTSNSAGSDGGVVYGYPSSTITIEGGTFEQNTANSGGVISGSTITILDGRFTSNSADSNGGVIYGYRSSTITVEAGTFTSNTAGSIGGVVYGHYSSTITIEGGTFTSNSAGSNGGVVYGHPSSTITIKGGTFEQNTAYNGGVVYGYTSSIIMIESGTFTLNNSSYNGGVIYIDSSSLNPSTLTIKNGTFTSNTAGSIGGVVYGLYSSTITIEGGTFTSNTANYGGGVIFGNTSSTITVEAGTFTSNSATNQGGVIYISSSSSSPSTLTIKNGFFEHNTAADGGVIYGDSSSTIENGTFISNSAKIHGSAISNSGSTTIEGGTFDANNDENLSYYIYAYNLKITGGTFNNFAGVKAIRLGSTSGYAYIEIDNPFEIFEVDVSGSNTSKIYFDRPINNNILINFTNTVTVNNQDIIYYYRESLKDIESTTVNGYTYRYGWLQGVENNENIKVETSDSNVKIGFRKDTSEGYEKSSLYLTRAYLATIDISGFDEELYPTDDNNLTILERNGWTKVNNTRFTLNVLGGQEFNVYIPTRLGYTFAGWNVRGNAELISSNSEYCVYKVSNQNVTFKPTWNETIYTITYLDRGETDNIEFSGTLPDNAPYEYTITSGATLQNATKIYYIFNGWYDSFTGGNKVTNIPAGQTGDIKLYAEWIRAVVRVNVANTSAINGTTFDDGYVYYADIQMAIDDIITTENVVLELLCDFEISKAVSMSDKDITIKPVDYSSITDANVTTDNDITITRASAYFGYIIDIKSNSKLTIDVNVDKILSFIGSENQNNYGIILNAGELIINNGIFSNSSNSSNYSNIINNLTNSNLTINNGDFSSTNAQLPLIRNLGNVTINGGNYTNDLVLIDTNDNSELQTTLNISNGTFNGTISTNNSIGSTININGGLFNGAVEIAGNTLATINNGTFNDNLNVAYTNGSVKIVNGNFSKVVVSGEISIEVLGGTFNSLTNNAIFELSNNASIKLLNDIDIGSVKFNNNSLNSKIYAKYRPSNVIKLVYDNWQFDATRNLVEYYTDEYSTEATHSEVVDGVTYTWNYGWLSYNPATDTEDYASMFPLYSDINNQVSGNVYSYFVTEFLIEQGYYKSFIRAYKDVTLTVNPNYTEDFDMIKQHEGLTDEELFTLYGISYISNSSGNEEEIFTLDSFTITKTYGQTLQFRQILRRGYSFNGWTSDTSNLDFAENGFVYTFGASDSVTITADWLADTYTINFVGGSQDGFVATGSMNSIEVQFDEIVQLPANQFVLDGYNFVGWLISGYNGNTARYSATNEFNPGTYVTEVNNILYDEYFVLSLQTNGIVTLTAQWTNATYTVSFDANGGNVDELSKQVVYNQPYGELPIPTRTGYEFIGWFTDADNGTKVETTTIYLINDDSTLYAHWQASSVRYVVRHYYQDLTQDDNLTVTLSYTTSTVEELSGLSDSIININDLVKDKYGFNFISGNETGNPSDSVNNITISPNGTTVVYLYYERLQGTINIIINDAKDSQGIVVPGVPSASSVSGSGTYYFEQIVKLQAVITLGCEFTNWESMYGSFDNDTLNPTNYTVERVNETVNIYVNVTVNVLNFSTQTLSSGKYKTAYSTNFAGASNGSGDYSYELISLTIDNIVTDITETGLEIVDTEISGTPLIAGNYVLTIRAIDNITKQTATANKTIAISKFDLSVVIPNQYGIYGYNTEVQQLEGELSAELPTGDDYSTLEITLTRSQGDVMGIYDILAVSENKNYNITFTLGKYYILGVFDVQLDNATATIENAVHFSDVADDDGQFIKSNSEIESLFGNNSTLDISNGDTVVVKPTELGTLKGTVSPNSNFGLYRVYLKENETIKNFTTNRNVGIVDYELSHSISSGIIYFEVLEYLTYSNANYTYEMNESRQLVINSDDWYWGNVIVENNDYYILDVNNNLIYFYIGHEVKMTISVLQSYIEKNYRAIRFECFENTSLQKVSVNSYGEVNIVWNTEAYNLSLGPVVEINLGQEYFTIDPNSNFNGTVSLTCYEYELTYNEGNLNPVATPTDNIRAQYSLDMNGSTWTDETTYLTGYYVMRVNTNTDYTLSVNNNNVSVSVGESVDIGGFVIYRESVDVFRFYIGKELTSRPDSIVLKIDSAN